MRRYVGPPQNVYTQTCTPGQLGLLEFDSPGVLRVFALGAPGAGKTTAALIKAAILGLQRPNSTIGLVAPTNDRRQILWNQFLEMFQPLGWVESVEKTAKRIVLANRTVYEVLAAKKPSAAQGNPLQGRSWDACVIDESQNVEEDSQIEIDARGRRAGTSYVVFETGTNQTRVPGFKLRLESYKSKPATHRIMRFDAASNTTVDPATWKRLKESMPEREFRRLYLVEDIAPEHLVYPSFSYTETLRPVPANYADITPQVTQEHFGSAYAYVAGQDFGRLCHATIMLKCYREPGTGERLWFAVDEITSYRSLAAVHARKIVNGGGRSHRSYSRGEFIVVADPHHNSPDTDKSDYAQFVREGLTILPSVGAGGKISREHRLSMVNTLLEDANGKRRLFVATDAHNKPLCPDLVAALTSLEVDDQGRAERDKKDANDKTHWPAAMGYGLFRFEKLRAPSAIQMLTTLGKDFARSCQVCGQTLEAGGRCGFCRPEV